LDRFSHNRNTTKTARAKPPSGCNGYTLFPRNPLQLKLTSSDQLAFNAS